MTVFLTALGLAIVIEGVCYALFPDAMKKMMQHVLADVTNNPAEWYNDDQQLAQAIEAAVAAVAKKSSKLPPVAAAGAADAALGGGAGGFDDDGGDDDDEAVAVTDANPAGAPGWSRGGVDAEMVPLLVGSAHGLDLLAGSAQEVRGWGECARLNRKVS